MEKKLFQEQFNPALYQLVQNVTIPWESVTTGGWAPGWFWHTWSSGSVRQWNWEHSCAWEGPSHTASPARLHCPCRCGEYGLSFSWIPCAVWPMTCRTCLHHLAGRPSQKRAPNYTPFPASAQGEWGKGPAIPPFPFPPFSPALWSSAVLPRVRVAGLMRGVPVMNASSWNCGCVSQAWCSCAKM